MSILNNALLLKKAADADPPAGDVVTKSLRFNAGDTPFLQRTTGTSSDQTKCTHSFWMKRSTLGANQRIFEGGSNAGFLMNGYSSSDEFRVNNNGPLAENTTTQLLRDTSAFYHICVSIDSALSSADQLKLYINGTRVTSFSRTDSIETNQALNPSGTDATIGKAYGDGEHFDGYLADYYMLDGVAAAATDFAEEDATTGQWKPKAYSGSYGDNGFHLSFEEDSATSGSNAGIGKDVSGNGNYFNTTNLASDVVNDTPTANYCVLNALDYSGGATLAEGNLEYDTSGWNEIRGTMAVSSGKWYYEVYVDNFNTSSEAFSVGIAEVDGALQNTYWSASWDNAAYGRRYGVNLNSTTVSKIEGGSSSTISATISNGDVISILLDLDSATTTLKFWVNGGSEQTLYSSLAAGTYAIGFNSYTASLILNAGQDPTFAGNGPVGSPATSEFAYTPTSGYKAWAASNLTPTIAKSSDHFSTKLYSGTGNTTQNITGVGFSPDLVWIKNRNTAVNHYLHDSVRGLFNLQTNTTNVEAASTNRFNSFDSDGFQVEHSGGGNGYTNGSGQTYVAWSWKAGTSFEAEAGESTSGSKNVDAGFSIATWTGDAEDYDTGTQVINHGLTVAPEMIIAKGRTANDSMGAGWFVYHKDTSTGTYLVLDTNDSEAGDEWTDLPITSIGTTSVNVGTDDSSIYLNYGGDEYSDADTYVAYFFAGKDSFSRFGKFTGTEDTSGVFVYCGFRPAMILTKKATGLGAWTMWDDARPAYNPANKPLYPNTSGAEPASDYPVDFCSNGFVIRTDNDDINGSGETHIFGAWASAPFKLANAR